MTAVARKTLLLDLDNTLVLTTITYNGDVFGDLNFKLLEEDGSYSEYCVVFRHYVQEFIRRCQIFYNVGIFTAAERDYADRILDVLCPDVRLRFYSEDCKEGGHVKDLTALRGIEFDPTSFLLFDDRAPDNTIPHENGMCCPSFMHSEEQEHALQIFADVLCDERFHGVPDIRVPLSKYEQVRQNRMKSQQPNRTCSTRLEDMTIEFVILVNKQGQTRFSHYYRFAPVEKRVSYEGEIGRRCIRRKDTESSFFDYENYMIVYRRYASLFFIVGVNSSFVYCRQNIGDNLLGIYEFIHCAVEALDEYFENVCEIDVMFNVEKVHIVFDEMLSNGYICEINKKNILCPLELGE